MEDYDTIREQGTRILANGYHYPLRPYQICNCKPTTSKDGAYRDEIYEYQGKTYYFLHQNLIMVKDGNQYRLSSCRWKTPTTKKRLNDYLPNGWFIFQKDYEWFLQKGHSSLAKPIKFFDGMILEIRPNDHVLDGFIIKETA